MVQSGTDASGPGPYCTGLLLTALDCGRYSDAVLHGAAVQRRVMLWPPQRSLLAPPPHPQACMGTLTTANLLAAGTAVLTLLGAGSSSSSGGSSTARGTPSEPAPPGSGSGSGSLAIGSRLGSLPLAFAEELHSRAPRMATGQFVPALQLLCAWGVHAGPIWLAGFLPHTVAHMHQMTLRPGMIVDLLDVAIKLGFRVPRGTNLGKVPYPDPSHVPGLDLERAADPDPGHVPGLDPVHTPDPDPGPDHGPGPCSEAGSRSRGGAGGGLQRVRTGAARGPGAGGSGPRAAGAVGVGVGSPWQAAWLAAWLRALGPLHPLTDRDTLSALGRLLLEAGCR